MAERIEAGGNNRLATKFAMQVQTLADKESQLISKINGALGKSADSVAISKANTENNKAARS